MVTDTRPSHTEQVAPSRPPRPWWHTAVGVGITLLSLAALVAAVPAPAVGSAGWWLATIGLHAPFCAISAFLAAGFIERVGFLWRGRRMPVPGALPVALPSVCVQVPLFNEAAVSARIIAAVGALRWPNQLLHVQVLDDSTDADARALVDAAADTLRARRDIRVDVLRRVDRVGYKAGALEAGRRRTDAEFIAIFDADFLPTPDFLERCVPHFFDADGAALSDLALVQAQWGHLNASQSALTRAQSLWVDDHHTVQMSWRASRWDFVNFTGTAGIWRASAIQAAGGWKAASLVEDCELSFRHLFAGYRTTFVRSVIAPAELPATFTAYKAQQRRWTQGWAQVQRLHLRTLARAYETSPARRLHLLYHMGIPWQWPLWGLWVVLLPALIDAGLWFGVFGPAVGATVYLAPMVVWVVLATVLASLATPQPYPDAAARLRARLARIVPYVAINTGMLPHQFCAYLEGLAGPLHTEFERTPKTAALGGANGATAAASAPRAKRASVRIHWPYVVAEMCFVVYQLGWALAFAVRQELWPALGALFLAVCIVGVGVFYGDHAGRVLFVVDRDRLRWPGRCRRAAMRASRDGQTDAAPGVQTRVWPVAVNDSLPASLPVVVDASTKPSAS